MKKLFLLIITLCVTSLTQAEPLALPSVQEVDSTAIESQFLSEVTYEEPSFEERQYEREIASLVPSGEATDVEWQGQLMVLKEIPYSYAQLSRRTLQLRTLAEIEQEELNQKQPESVSE